MNATEIKALAKEAVDGVRNQTLSTREANVFLGAGRLTLSVLRFELQNGRKGKKA